MLTGLLLYSALTAPLPASPVLHYKLDLKVMRRMERSATDTVGGDFTASAFLSVSFRDTTGGRIGHVVVDSVSCQGTGILSMAYDPAVGRASTGAWYDVVLVPGNRDRLPRPSIQNPLTGALVALMPSLFPPAHLSSHSGDTWADTLDVPTSAEGWTQKGPAITRWKTTGSTADGTTLDGDVSAVMSVTGRVTATLIAVGKHTMTLTRDGIVRAATITSSQQGLMAEQFGSEIRAGRGTTSASIILIP